jgi:hypothetical protein
MKRTAGLGAGVALCLCVVLASLFSENFIAARADHDCRGEGCPVCLWLQGARTLARQFKYAVFPSGLFPGALPLLLPVSGLAALRPAPASSVKLKVKMNE